MSLKSDKGKSRHRLPRSFRSGKGGKNTVSSRDDHDEVRMPFSLILNLSDPPPVEDRPSGAIPEEASRDHAPPSKDAGEVREEFLQGEGSVRGLIRRHTRSRRILEAQPSAEKWLGDDPPRALTAPQSSADPPFVEDRPPGAVPEEAYRDPDPPPTRIIQNLYTNRKKS